MKWEQILMSDLQIRLTLPRVTYVHKTKNFMEQLLKYCNTVQYNTVMTVLKRLQEYYF
jgi:hypothetical protein